MSRPMSTTTPGMMKAGASINDSHGVVSNGRQTIADNLSALFGTWRGDASMEFNKAMNAWFSDCDIILRKLDEMHGLMVGNANVISKGEEANVEYAAEATAAITELPINR